MREATLRARRLVRTPIGGIVSSLLIALILVSVLFLLLGVNPLEAFGAIVRGAFGSLYSIGQTVQVMSVLTLAALAAALPFRTGVLNVGGEGQITMGAVAAAVVILGGPQHWSSIIWALIAAIIAGGLWGLIVGVMKAYLGTNEVINALMLNFVAVLVAAYVIAGPWADTLAPQTQRFPDAAQLPSLTLAQGLNLTPLIIALLAVVFVWLLLERSVFGFSLRLMGANPEAAQRAGLKEKLLFICVLALGGGLAGLAGVIQATSVNHALIQDPAQGYGYTGIAVALLAALRIGFVPLSAVFFAVLAVGSNSLPAVTGVSTSASLIVQGVFVICLLAVGALRLKGSGRS